MLLQPVSDGRRILRQAHPVHPDPVTGHMLAGHDGGSSRHANHVLIMCAPVVNALGRQRVDGRCAGNGAAVAAQCVVAHLVRGNQEYFFCPWVPQAVKSLPNAAASAA